MDTAMDGAALATPRIPRLDRVAYRAQQLSLLYQGLALQRFARWVTRVKSAQPTPETEAFMQRRFEALLDRDLANVDAGLYPRELLFQIPYGEYARTFPALLRDAPRSYLRMRARNFRDLPPDVDAERYPPYYRRNFHWQTDGYLSQRSARLYDVGVELLFLGTADVMRRQIIPPVTRYLARHRGRVVRLLDVACGTGSALRQLAVAHPAVRYYGLDLSPYYLQVARRRLRHLADLSLVAENAEHMPFTDGFFDVVTSVYLFHELPRAARRRVVREAFRVLRPGGLFVVEDSAQLSDSPEIEVYLQAFAQDFHEPFYPDYVRDDLAALLRDEGFEVFSDEPHMVAKVVAARRPE